MLRVFMILMFAANLVACVALNKDEAQSPMGTGLHIPDIPTEEGCRYLAWKRFLESGSLNKARKAATDCQEGANVRYRELDRKKQEREFRNAGAFGQWVYEETLAGRGGKIVCPVGNFEFRYACTGAKAQAQLDISRRKGYLRDLQEEADKAHGYSLPP